MGVQPLGARETHGGRSDRGKRGFVAADEGGAFHEVEHPESGGETRAAGGRQNVVGAGDVIADRFGGMAPQENSPGMANAFRKIVGLVDRELQMFRGDAVDQRRRPRRANGRR